MRRRSPFAIFGKALSCSAAERGGSLAIGAAFLLPILLLAAGGGVDYVTYLGERSKFQQAADAAALAGAKELSLSDSNHQNVAAVVEAMVAANVASPDDKSPLAHTVTSRLVNEPGAPLQVEVNVATVVKSIFGSRFGLGDAKLDIRSIAMVVGKPNICLLTLDPSSQGALDLDNNAKIIGNDCSIYSNSRHVNGLKSHQSAVMTATSICTAGGKSGSQGNFQPEPITDCPQFADPLAGRPEPAIGACTSNSLVVDNQTIELSPGTFCGGLTIKGAARVTFRSGIYIIKDGPLQVSDTAAVEGVNVGFYLVGQASRFRFERGTSISLIAPKDGEMASLLFFGSRAQNEVQSEIFSDDARQLLGIIYLPKGLLRIDANRPVGDLSAYTAIVVKRLRALSGPTISLNANYRQTDVPVPDGIRGAGQPIALSK